jgi:NAD(P)-dependent dehydrogenase (short-subunit alcohol dehydrogenase family)
VTGAASGVGASAVSLFAAEGARVVAGDARGSALREAHQEQARGVTLLEADVTRPGECDALVRTALDAHGRVDVLFNNAGATIRGTLEDTDDAILEAALGVNLLGVVHMCRATVRHMRARRGGAIVNNASVTALEGLPGAVAYTAAKGGVVALTRALAVELAPHGIRVNAICPGAIDSPMTNDYLATQPDPEQQRTRLLARHPLGRLATPRDVAHAAPFLASDDAAFISGAVLPVDGGRQAAGPGTTVAVAAENGPGAEA